MHWTHDNCRAKCGAYGYMDAADRWCSAGCPMYSSCRKYGATNVKKRTKRGRYDQQNEEND